MAPVLELRPGDLDRVRRFRGWCSPGYVLRDDAGKDQAPFETHRRGDGWAMSSMTVRRAAISRSQPPTCRSVKVRQQSLVRATHLRLGKRGARKAIRQRNMRLIPLLREVGPLLPALVWYRRRLLRVPDKSVLKQRPNCMLQVGRSGMRRVFPSQRGYLPPPNLRGGR